MEKFPWLSRLVIKDGKAGMKADCIHAENVREQEFYNRTILKTDTFNKNIIEFQF